METIIIGLLIIVLIASAFFNAVTWVFNWVAVAILLVVWVVLMYNRFIALINQAKEAWSDIAVQLKRRYDLIPNLIETVKGYAAHESSVFENVSSFSLVSCNHYLKNILLTAKLNATMESIYKLWAH